MSKCAPQVALTATVVFLCGMVGAIVIEPVPGYQGPIKMKFTNWDTGTVYNVDDGLYEGEGALDALAQVPAPGQLAGEDTWGVFRLDSITDESGMIDLWNRFTAETELTGIFWGGRDVYLNQTTGPGGTSQQIHSGGIAAARTAAGAFDTFTDGGLAWTMNTVPGHNADFPTHEFFTEFWPDAAVGNINAAGGAFAQVGAVDLDGDGVATDVGALNSSIIPNNIAPGADFAFEFTGEPDATGTWLVVSDDPIRTAIPEPTTLALLSMGGLAMARRRRCGGN